VSCDVRYPRVELPTYLTDLYSVGFVGSEKRAKGLPEVEALPPPRKHPSMTVMSVIIVISGTFPYTYGGFLHDGEVMGSLGSVIPSSRSSTWRKRLR
jgi:hypothetical protein